MATTPRIFRFSPALTWTVQHRYRVGSLARFDRVLCPQNQKVQGRPLTFLHHYIAFLSNREGKTSLMLYRQCYWPHTNCVLRSGVVIHPKRTKYTNYKILHGKYFFAVKAYEEDNHKEGIQERQYTKLLSAIQPNPPLPRDLQYPGNHDDICSGGSDRNYTRATTATRQTTSEMPRPSTRHNAVTNFHTHEK